GKVHWTYEVPVGANMTIPTPRLAGDKLFLTCFYSGCRLLQLTGGASPSAQEGWRSRGRGERPKQTDKLPAVMCTPVINGEHIYRVWPDRAARRPRPHTRPP